MPFVAYVWFNVQAGQIRRKNFQQVSGWKNHAVNVRIFPDSTGGLAEHPCPVEALHFRL